MAIHITSKSKSLSIKPTTKDELRSIIEKELEHQGPDADLNFIGTSKITDMSDLFVNLCPQNIKIDEWDVSNVTDMSNMFYCCVWLECDLSGWDVSDAKSAELMFFGCYILDRHKPDFSLYNSQFKKL